MINLNDCIELGVLTRPHGIKGNLVLKLNDLSFDEIEEMELVFILIDGLPVPFFIEEFSERNPGSILIKLDDIDSESEARKYSNAIVYINRNIISRNISNQFNPALMKGYRVVDKSYGEIGQIDSLLEFDQNPVLRILKDKQEILLPFRDEFLLEINEEAKEVQVDCPDGLLDLYL